jgi:hypothetical protein
MSLEESTQIKKPTVVSVVRSFLQKYYDENRLHELKFEDIDAQVRVHFPNSKFNPYHLAHYKHKFLLKMNYVKMDKKWRNI